jgi:hypothetical protein
MPPEPRVVPRFAAEPPQEELPYGRWAGRLADELRSAWSALASEAADLGEPGEIVWYPDRSWAGSTYQPASARADSGHELFGYVRFPSGVSAPSELEAHGDYTEETAERNPDWRLDLCQEEIGAWRGVGGGTATMTLVWGRPLLGGGSLVTAELGGVTVDQCPLIEQRFTLIAPDDYQHDLLEVKLWDARGRELAKESLYDE